MRQGLAVLLLALATPVAAQVPAALPGQIQAADPRAPVYVTSHVDVTPDKIEQAKAILRTYVEAARREPGAVRVEAVEEARLNHFDLIELWRDRAAFDAHQKTAPTIQFHDAIFPLRGSPFEERLGTLIAP